MKLGRTIARAVIGGLFAAHGAQKTFGWFGGYGPDGTGQFFEGNLGLKPGKRNALAAGYTEIGGGALLASGVGTPIAASALIGTMITAVRTAHLKNGPFVNDGGWEYNAVLIATLVTLADEEDGPLAALGALAAGAIGSELVLRASRAQADEPAAAEAARETEPQAPVADPATA